jgi:hypothetical protein
VKSFETGELGHSHAICSNLDHFDLVRATLAIEVRLPPQPLEMNDESPVDLSARGSFVELIVVVSFPIDCVIVLRVRSGEEPLLRLGQLNESDNEWPLKVAPSLPCLPLWKFAAQVDIERVVVPIVDGEMHFCCGGQDRGVEKCDQIPSFHCTLIP